MWFGWIGRIEEAGHDCRQLLEVDWFGDVGVEARLNAFRVYVAENVGREGDDREMLEFVLALPLADVFAGLIAIFIRHVEVAL